MDDEAILIRSARSGDREAFGRLVQLYQRPVFSLAYRMLGSAPDAEDAAQESFLRAYRALGGYDSGRAFSTWLLSIAAHHCIDRIRRKRMHELSLDAVPQDCWRSASDAGPEASVERRAEAERVGRCLAALPEDYRLVVVLRYWHDMGYADIARILGESESAVKSRLHRARLRLAELLPAADGRGEAPRPRSSDGSSHADGGDGEVSKWSANARAI